MLRDARDLAPGDVLSFDVIVVGAGPAGISLARALRGRGLAVGLLESGGTSDEAETHFQEALALRQRYFTRLAESAAESEALRFAGQIAISQDMLLTATAGGQKPEATYAALWAGRAGLGQVAERRHFALLAAADRPDVRADWDELTATRRRLTRLLLNPGRDAKAHDEGAVVLAIPREVLTGILDIQKLSSLRLLKILCTLVATRLRELDDKVVGWYILAGGSAGGTRHGR